MKYLKSYESVFNTKNKYVQKLVSSFNKIIKHDDFNENTANRVWKFPDDRWTTLCYRWKPMTDRSIDIQYYKPSNIQIMFNEDNSDIIKYLESIVSKNSKKVPSYLSKHNSYIITSDNLNDIVSQLNLEEAILYKNTNKYNL